MTAQARPPPLDRRDLVAWVALVAIGIWAHWGVTAVGPFGDDYMQHGMVTGQYPGHHAPWNLYDFIVTDPVTRAAHLRMGVVPWWTAPDLYGGLLRPLPSLTVWFDHAQFSRATFVHRVHTLGWWGLALASTGLLLRRVFGRWIAAVALAVFAIDHGTVLPLSWLANRVMVQTVAFGFVALWLHLRWREDGLRHGPWWTFAAMAATFACGEYALVVAGYVLAWELVVGRRHRAHPGARGWATALAPTVVPMAIYLAFHVAGRYGTVGSAMYVHPFTDPVGYLGWAWDRVPRLLAELVSSAPSETWEFAFRYGWHPGGEGRGGHMLVAWGIVAVAAVAFWIVRAGLSAAERTALAWLVLGAALGTFPVASAPAHGRLLLLSQLGGAALVAAIIVAGVRLAAGRVAARWPRRIVALAIAGGMAWVHGPVDVAYGRQVTQRLQLLHDGIRFTLMTPATQGVRMQGRDVVVMSSVVLTLVIHAPLVADYYRIDVPRSWHVLSTNDAPLAVVRTDARTLDVSFMRGETWLASAQDRLFCPEPRTLPTGTRIDAGVFTAEVLADVDGRPTKVRFVFEHELEHARYLFLRKKGIGLVPFEIPAVGRVNVVPFPSAGGA